MGSAEYACGAHSGKLTAAAYACGAHIKPCVKIATAAPYALGSHIDRCSVCLR